LFCKPKFIRTDVEELELGGKQKLYLNIFSCILTYVFMDVF